MEELKNENMLGNPNSLERDIRARVESTAPITKLEGLEGETE